MLQCAPSLSSPPYATSTKTLTRISPFPGLNTIPLSLVALIYFITLYSFLMSSSSHFRTLVARYDTPVSTSGLPLFAKYSSCANSTFSSNYSKILYKSGSNFVR